MYLPLKVIDTYQKEYSFERLQQMFASAGAASIYAMTEEDFILFMLSKDFLRPEKNDKYKDLAEVLVGNLPTLIKTLGITDKQVREQKIDIHTEMKDIFLTAPICLRWKKYKLVYKPNEDFTEALLHTSKLELYRSSLLHLPCSTFYLDVSENHLFPGFSGVFVSFTLDKDYAYFSMYALTDKEESFSFYTTAKFGTEEKIELQFSDIPVEETYIATPFRAQKKTEQDLSVSRRDLFSVVFQMICYLSSKEPDIKENEITKKTYRKTEVIRNKFSEIQQFDVGVRIGTKIRTQIEEAKEIEEEMQEDGPRFIPLKKPRKSPIPHFRCAHWQTYHVGEGRQQIEVKWIEPTFVGGITQARDVVIHEIE